MPMEDGRIRLIIAGSRPPKAIRKDPERLLQWYRRQERDKLIWKALDESPFRFFEIGEVVSGGAEGVDRLGERWAKGEGVGVRVVAAKWTDAEGRVDRGAGVKRNQEMAQYADALLAVWDGESRGTRDMVERMVGAGKRVWVAVML